MEEGFTVKDFVSLGPRRGYTNLATGEKWPRASVDALLSPAVIDGKRMKASEYLDMRAKAKDNRSGG
jgi:hypothetical protein